MVKNVKSSFASSFLGDFASWWPIFAAGKGLYAKGRLDFLRRKKPTCLFNHYLIVCVQDVEQRKSHGQKSNHQFVADNVWWPVPRFLPLSSRRYMALASEPERISLFWRVTGSCVALLLCLPAVFLITFLALWLTLPPLLSFSEMFRAVSS